jgi:hypothetical protein
MLSDALTTLRFIEDDGKIFSLSLSKFWGPQPGLKLWLVNGEKNDLTRTKETCNHDSQQNV